MLRSNIEDLNLPVQDKSVKQLNDNDSNRFLLTNTVALIHQIRRSNQGIDSQLLYALLHMRLAWYLKQNKFVYNYLHMHQAAIM